MFVLPLFFFMIAGCVLLAVLVGLSLLFANKKTRPAGLAILGCLLVVPFVGFISYQSRSEARSSEVRSDAGVRTVTTELAPQGTITYASRTTRVAWAALLLPVLAVAALAAAAWRCFDRRRPAAGGIVSLVAVAIVLLCGLRLWEMQPVASTPIATAARASDGAMSTEEAFDKLTEPRIVLEPSSAIEPPDAVVPPEAIAPPLAAPAVQAAAARPSPASQERLMLVMAIAGLVLLAVAGAYGVLRVDEATSGRGTKWLLIVAGAVIMPVVLSLLAIGF